MLSALLVMFTLEGCSMCTRLKELSPELQRLFCLLLAGVLAAALALYMLYRSVRAQLLPGIPYSRKQQAPVLGMLAPLQRNFFQFGEWRNHMIAEQLADHRQAQMHALVEKGRDGAALEALPLTPLVQWSLPLTSSPFVEILTAEGLRHVLSDDFLSFEKGAMLHDVLEELLGDGIFNADGNVWRQQRKVASHMFSFHKLNDYMFQTFTAECERLTTLLANYTRTGEVIDFQQLMFDFTFDAICKIAFGLHMDQMGSKSVHPFCFAFDDVQTITTFRSLSIPLVWKTKRALNIGNEARFKKHMVTINSFIYNIVSDRRANASEYGDDLLTLFLQDATKRGEELSDEYLRNIILNFMVAGRDTTATALTWLFYAFSKFPATEAPCVREVRSSLSASVQPTAEAIKSLTQLEAAFMETTRLWPPVPADIKECVKDSVFPCGTKIPKGTIVCYTMRSLCRLPQFYESTIGLKHWAADCDQFKPERWVVPNEEKGGVKILQPSNYDFPSFNAGLRLCLGKSMAILEGKMVASTILQQFRIQLQDGFVPQERVSIVWGMKQGMPVTVHLRK